jgi:hypothetical protein
MVNRKVLMDILSALPLKTEKLCYLFSVAATGSSFPLENNLFILKIINSGAFQLIFKTLFNDPRIVLLT